MFASVAHKWAEDFWDDVLVPINIALLTELRRAISQSGRAAVAPVFDRRSQRLNRERRRMLFASRQPAKRINDLSSRQLHSIFARHSFDHFGERRTTSKRRRTTVREEARRFDAAIAETQR